MIANRLRWRPRKALTALGLFSVNLYALGCFSLWLGQSRFVFFPQKEIATTPERYSLKYQDVYLPVTTSDGKSERMHGW